MTVKLELLWVMPKQGDKPFTPYAQIVAKKWMKDERYGDTPVLSAQCMTRAEIDEQIQLFKDDLEAIKKEAYRKFR